MGGEGGGVPEVLFAAVVDDTGDFAAEVLAGDDLIDEAFFAEELSRLETFGEFGANGAGNDAWAGEADHGFGFGKDDIAEHGEAGGGAAVSGVGEDGEEEAAFGIIACEGGGGFSHLHEGEGGFLHACAAGAADDDEGKVFRGGAFNGAGQFFADDRTHGAGHEGEVHDGDDDGAAFDEGAAGLEAVLGFGFLLFIQKPLGIGLFVGKLEDIAGGSVGIHFFEGAGVDEHFDAGGGGVAEVVAAVGAGVELFFHGFAVDHGRAFGAFEPKAFGDVDVFSWSGHLFPFGCGGVFGRRLELGHVFYILTLGP